MRMLIINEKKKYTYKDITARIFLIRSVYFWHFASHPCWISSEYNLLIRLNANQIDARQVDKKNRIDNERNRNKYINTYEEK
jgi:hypothetical protein